MTNEEVVLPHNEYAGDESFEMILYNLINDYFLLIGEQRIKVKNKLER